MASRESLSIFSYNVTRRYPFKWFTSVTVVGAVIFLVLFSFLNFVSTGFNLVVQYSANPNATVAGDVWLERWPSYLSHKVQPTCQTADIPVNTQFFTNQKALKYTLTAVWQKNNTSLNILPSLTYYNNRLDECTITSIEINLEAMDRAANQFAYSEWGEVITSYMTCSISTANGTTMFNLTQEYDYVPATLPFSELYVFLGTNFLERNPITKASLWWGESLLSTYWGILSGAMQIIREDQTGDEQPGIRKGTIALSRDYTTTSDIASLDFFQIDFRFIVDWGWGNFSVIAPGDYDYSPTTDHGGISKLARRVAYPDIWEWADRLGKSAYSTILVDLGQSVVPNILTNATALQYYTQLFPDPPFIANAKPGPAIQDYDTLRDATGPLGITPSVISTEYLCQIPQRKSAGNLFVSILVGDLVLLQAIWQLFKLGTAAVLLRKIPRAQYCEGCASAREWGEGAELTTLKPPSKQGLRSRQRSVSEQSLIT